MNPSIKTLIERGDIVTTRFDPQPAVGRYQGNGRFGSVYSQFGLHAHPDEKEGFDVYGLTQFTHIEHWGRFVFRSESMQADTSADYILPLARIHWKTTPRNIESYRQTQSFHDGTLTTEFRCDGGAEVAVTTWFDPVHRNLAMIDLRLAGRVPPIVLTVPTEFAPYPYGYNKPATQTFCVVRDGNQWCLEIACDTATPPRVSRIFVRSDAHIEACPEGLLISLSEGASSVGISYGEPVEDAASADSLGRTIQWWRDTWENTAWFDFPDENSQKMWVRSLAYILSSFNDDGLGFTPTNGLTGNPFPFNFAQDLFYVHPVLLATGHAGVARAWIERFRALLDGMKLYAKRVWPEVAGIYPPWELPFGPIDGYHTPSVPIFYCYEPHNAAYLARMAHETGIMLDNPAWTRENVVPLIREIALFYRSFCKKEADGRWHFFLAPSIGQDEAGGRNQKDYLCVFYSAKYSFQRAVEYGLDEDGEYRQILADGLAFDALHSPHGFYYASAGAGEKDFGQQKHPVQLNGLAYLPVESQPLPPERVAHQLRYETTSLAAKPHFFGWTLGEFLLASSRLGDVDGWRKDWSNVRPSNYTDEDWVQVYETSGTTRQPFYVTTHGLFAQSLAGNVVSDYWGRLAIAPCRVFDGPVRFGNFRSLLGVTAGGEITGTAVRVTLEAWKDCALEVTDVRISLAKGEKKELVFGSPNIHASPARIPVILDTDIGTDIDDTWALAHLLHCPELDIRLVLAASGDTVFRARVATKFLAAAGRSDIPVGLGVSGPLGKRLYNQEPWVESWKLEDYPGEIVKDGVGRMIQLINDSPVPVTIISIAPAFNIAAALGLVPGIAPRARFVGMFGSFAVGYDGATAASAETNVRVAPEAFRVALSAPWLDVLLTPLDTCGLAILDGELYRRIRSAAGDPALGALIENYRVFASRVDWMTCDFFDVRSTVLFDCVAVYLAYSEDLVEVEKVCFHVTDDGFTVPDPAGPYTARVALRWKNLSGFLEHLAGRLLGTDATPGQTNAST